jgi:hypothetical protein
VKNCFIKLKFQSAFQNIIISTPYINLKLILFLFKIIKNEIKIILKNKTKNIKMILKNNVAINGLYFMILMNIIMSILLLNSEDEGLKNSILIK